MQDWTESEALKEEKNRTWSKTLFQRYRIPVKPATADIYYANGFER
jgi:hypothetical protein